MLGHAVSKTSTELSYIKRSSHLKDVSTGSIWTFPLAVGDGIDIPVSSIVRFMQRNQIPQQHQNNDTFCRPRVVNAQCITGIQKIADAGIKYNYAIDKYSQTYREKVSYFRHLAKTKFYKPILQKKILGLLLNVQMIILVIIYMCLI